MSAVHALFNPLPGEQSEREAPNRLSKDLDKTSAFKFGSRTDRFGRAYVGSDDLDVVDECSDQGRKLLDNMTSLTWDFINSEGSTALRRQLHTSMP